MKKNYRKYINEAPIDYEGPERMNPNIERELAAGRHSFKDNPSFPKYSKEGPPDNFEELIASERFKKVIEKLKRYSGFQNITGNAISQVQSLYMSTIREVINIESQNQEYLKELAIELVSKEFGIDPDELTLNVEFKPLGGISQTDEFIHDAEEPSDEEIEEHFTDLENFVDAAEQFNSEVAKRRIINAMIHGSARYGDYLFELVKRELDAIDPRLYRLYGILMSFNDYLYWMMPTEQLQGMMQNTSAMTGKVDVNFDEEVPEVNVEGNFFPVIVHELTKGVIEAVGSLGLPQGRAGEMVVKKADEAKHEIWDLRLGPVIWQRLRAAIPDRVLQENKRSLQLYMLQKFVKLPANEFARAMRQIMANSPEGKRILDKIVSDVERMLGDYEMGQQGLGSERYDDDDDIGLYDDDDDLGSM